jgi:hypothetical protein
MGRNRNAGVIAKTKQWLLIERPGAGVDGWMNIWLSARSQNVDRHDFLIGYNVRSRRFNDCPAWKKLNTAYPETARWLVEQVRSRYGFGD